MLKRTAGGEAGTYAPAQVVLHWTIAALVVVQWLSSGAMETFFERSENGPPGFPDVPAAMLHAGSGAVILVLMLIRLSLRLRYGAPPLPADMPGWQQLLEHANHYAFYAILVLLPLTGVTALYILPAAAGLHLLLKTLLLVLIGLHILGAAYHAFIRRDGVVWRMLSFGGRG